MNNGSYVWFEWLNKYGVHRRELHVDQVAEHIQNHPEIIHYCVCDQDSWKPIISSPGYEEAVAEWQDEFEKILTGK